jgi:hypothetical protein
MPAPGYLYSATIQIPDNHPACFSIVILVILTGVHSPLGGDRMSTSSAILKTEASDTVPHLTERRGQ